MDTRREHGQYWPGGRTDGQGGEEEEKPAAVHVTPVEELPEGCTMKQIGEKVNELARIVSGAATALVCMVACGATPLEDIPGTNLMYTAAEVNAIIATNTPPVQVETDPTVPEWAKQPEPPYTGGGLTTNDVENIIAGTHDEWVSGYGTLTPVDGQTNVFSGLLVGVTWVTLHWGPDPEMPGILTWLWDCDGQDVNVNTGVPFEDATSVTLRLAGTYLGGILYGIDSITFIRKERNKFGLARLTDLPQNAAVPRILLKGEDGKTYSIKIDENRSLIIDEVNE